MDGPDCFSGFQDFRYRDDRNPLSTQNSGSRYTDGSLDLRHVSPQTDGSDLSRDFSHRNSRSLVFETPNISIAEVWISRHLFSGLSPPRIPVPGSPNWTIAQHASFLKSTTAIPSLFRDLKCLGFLDLENSDILSVDIPMPKCLSSGLSPRLFPMVNLVQLLSDPMVDEISK
jgi:hypothetical protein